MATNKKSFLLYCDLIHVFEELTDDEAGKLIKHTLRYVNGMNPEASDRLTKISFEPIKQQLIRDNEKYDAIVLRNRNNGAKGGRPKEEPKKPSGLFGNPKNPNKPDNDNDNDTVNDNKDKNDYKNMLLSEIDISELTMINNDYFEIAKSFQSLIRSNILASGGNDKNIKNAKGKEIDTIRLLIETDKFTIDDCRSVYVYLQKDDFWKKNILSISKLREKFNVLLIQSKNNGKDKRDYKEGTTFEELATIIQSKFTD